MKQYQAIGMGGTFDHFHVGHQHFLEFASSLAEKIVVGITSPQLSAHKIAADQIEAFDLRWKAVSTFLTQQEISFELFELNDTYGPTLQDSSVEAVAVTEQTVSGGSEINHKRQELGLPELPVHVCTMLRDANGELISSTRIRRGKINRAGFTYASLIKDGFVFSQEQSNAFKPAQGPVVLDVNPMKLTTPTFVVGDIVSETFLKHGWPVSLYVFDQKTLRQDYSSVSLQQLMDTTPVTALTNPAGQITKELTAWLSTYCDQLSSQQASTTILNIEGEEDLATVAAVLLAPLGARVYYGQPNQGMVELEITETLKEKFSKALQP